MSSKTEEKFLKYFRGKKKVKVLVKGKGGQDVPVYADLKSSKPVAKVKTFTEIEVEPNAKFEGRYYATYKGGRGYFADVNVGKPIPSKSVHLTKLRSLTSIDLVKGGKEIDLITGKGSVRCVEFKTHKDLVKVVMSNINTRIGFREPVIEVMHDFLKSDMKTIEWGADVEGEEIAIMGVYFGEILAGLHALAGTKSKIQTQGQPWKTKKVKRFMIPNDPRFSGVDSFIETVDGELYPISSKYGVGAPASFFTNILAKGVEQQKVLKKGTTFYEIVETAIALGYSPESLMKSKGAKEILYEFGIRKILKIGKKDIPDPHNVYETARAGKTSKEVKLVSTKIAHHPKAEQIIIDKLDQSITSFFSRESVRLMETDKSMDQMRSILFGKKYFQANLNKDKWEKGVVEFKFLSTKEAKLTLTASKSSPSSIEASWGMINYYLK